MDLPSPTLLLQLAFCAYALGVVGSLLALRREKMANLVGFGCATVAGALRDRSRRAGADLRVRAMGGRRSSSGPRWFPISSSLSSSTRWALSLC